LGERAQAAIAPGPLCEGVPAQSLERWDFWRSRLTQLASAQPPAGEDGAGEDGTSLGRIAQAVAVMDKASNSEQGL
jgi:hypothetical protein